MIHAPATLTAIPITESSRRRIGSYLLELPAAIFEAGVNTGFFQSFVFPVRVPAAAMMESRVGLTDNLFSPEGELFEHCGHFRQHGLCGNPTTALQAVKARSVLFAGKVRRHPSDATECPT
jgi:hypothetical protein